MARQSRKWRLPLVLALVLVLLSCAEVSGEFCRLGAPRPPAEAPG